jgi:hypothetical protein
VITVVSGLPRSGTSLMMQMLAAGGLTPLTDRLREANEENPRSYYEWEPIKQLPKTPALIEQAEGKVVKVISSLLLSLPLNYEYRVVFLRRPMAQIVASQAAMILRQTGSAPKLAPAAMQNALETHLRGVAGWLNARTAIPVHWVDYPALVDSPLDHAHALAAFLGGGLNADVMAAAVDASLHRNR